MARLLHVKIGTVGAPSLIRLSQERIQWFLELMTYELVCHGASHEQLHPLHRVRDRSCIVEIVRVHALDGWLYLQDRLGAHAFDWEADRSQVEIAREYSLAYHFHDFCPRASQSFNDRFIC